MKKRLVHTHKHFIPCTVIKHELQRDTLYTLRYAQHTSRFSVPDADADAAAEAAATSGGSSKVSPSSFVTPLTDADPAAAPPAPDPPTPPRVVIPSAPSAAAMVTVLEVVGRGEDASEDDGAAGGGEATPWKTIWLRVLEAGGGGGGGGRGGGEANKDGFSRVGIGGRRPCRLGRHRSVHATDAITCTC